MRSDERLDAQVLAVVFGAAKVSRCAAHDVWLGGWRSAAGETGVEMAVDFTMVEVVGEPTPPPRSAVEAAQRGFNLQTGVLKAVLYRCGDGDRLQL